ncbi:MAG: DoxX family membrane protein [Actinobacteria bacterium]|nr:DoxX family membrane protein [Actinomycetota bacterium]
MVESVVLGVFMLLAGVTHFANPHFFNDIVPPWLPPNESFWTYASGVAEVIVGILLLRSSTRRRGAIAAIWLFVAVYPANLYMTWDWRDRAVSAQVVSWVRLPLQFLLIWWAWRIAEKSREEAPWPGSTSSAAAPG